MGTPRLYEQVIPDLEERFGLGVDWRQARDEAHVFVGRLGSVDERAYWAGGSKARTVAALRRLANELEKWGPDELLEEVHAARGERVECSACGSTAPLEHGRAWLRHREGCVARSGQ